MLRPKNHIIKIIGLILIPAVMACGSKKSTTAGPVISREFGVTLEDTPVDTLQDYTKLKTPSWSKVSSGGAVTVQSKDWLGLSTELLEAGQSLASNEQSKLLEPGHNLIRE